MSKPVSFVDQLIKYLNHSGGRDKFSKTLQYACRMFMYFLLSKDPKNANGLKLQGLMAVVRDSRKLPRLLKFINEFQSISGIVSNPKFTSGGPKQLVDIVGKLGMAAYWYYDNLSLLQQAKFATFTYDVNYYSNLGWAVGIAVAMFNNVVVVSALQEEEAALKKKLASTSDSKETAGLNDRLKVVCSLKLKEALHLAANFGDFLLAAAGIQLPTKVLGHPLNDGVLGFAGLASALITGYYMWVDDVNKK